jgi:hypothetical protein
MFLAGLVLAIAAGCSGQPQVARNNRRLIESLQTAVSAKKTDWLEENARVIQERHAAGELSQAELASFQKIIDTARAGDWSQAQQDVFALGEAQRPTADDLERLRHPAEHEH